MSTIEAVFLAVVGMIILGLGITIWVEHGTIENLNTRITTADAKKAECDATNENWKATSQTQTNAIANLVTADKTRSAANDKAQAAAQSTRTAKEQIAASILAQPVDADDCKAAGKIMSIYLGSPK